MRATVLPGRILMIALLGCPLLAQAGAGSELEDALSAIRPEAIRSDLFFLADDLMRGRDTPSPELRIAARFIRARLERLGIQPGAPGGYLFRYPASWWSLDPERTHLAVSGERSTVQLEFGKDYFFASDSLYETRVEGPVVYCGDGEWDDFKELDLSGRWALCVENGPAHRREGIRAVRARKVGAIGLLVIPGPAYEGDPYPVRFARWTHLAPADSLRGPGWSPGAPTGEIARVYLEARVGRELLALAGIENRQPGMDLGLEVREERCMREGVGRIELENVAGFWPGNDPELAREVMIVMAHYDHLGVDSTGKVFNGADDNASGTCGLMAVAEALARRGPLRRSVLLLWLSGKERSRRGARAWTDFPWLPEGCRPVCAVNLDAIGRNHPGHLLVMPGPENPYRGALSRLAERLAPREGFAGLGDGDEYRATRDQTWFELKLRLPIALLSSDVHIDYHRPTDTPEKVDCDKVARVARLVARMLEELQYDEDPLEPAPEDVWRVARARGDLMRLRVAVERYERANLGMLPENLEQLLEADGQGMPWLRGYSAVPVDPWGRAFAYERSEEEGSWRVFTLGADGEMGGHGVDGDLDTLDW